MSRLHVLVFVAALAGCQAGPPANDPFMRPRVPPPGTGDITPIQPGVAAAPGGQPMAPVVTMPGTNYAPPAGNYNYSGAGSIYANPPAGSRGYTMPAGQTPAYTAPTTPQYTTPQYTTPPAGANPNPAQPGSSIYNRQSSWNRSADASASGRTGSRTITTSRINADRGADDIAGEDDVEDVADSDDSRVAQARYVDDQRAAAERAVAKPRRSTRGRGPADRGETYGFDPNYAWLHGRLEHSQVDGQWKLRYIPLDGKSDQYGGSVVLSEDSPVAGHQPGEFVSVAGSIASPSGKQDGFAPVYRAARIERLSL